MELKFKKICKHELSRFILLGLFLALFPSLAQLGLIKSGAVMIMGTMLIYTLAALGLNILLGYAGLISLGTAGFMGLAAYCSAYFTESLNLPFELALLLAVLLPTLLGTLVGVLSLRFEGIYLGIATLAVGEVLREVFIQSAGFTNGTSGAKANYPLLLGKFQLNRTGMYYFIVVVVIICFILTWQFLKGKSGRAFNAMRGSEAAAAAMGINIYKYRLLAFAVATFLASLAGVLYVHYIRISYPTTWSLALSLDFLAFIVVGGLRSIYGSLLGTFALFALAELLLKQIPLIANLSPIIKGVLMIVFVLYYPYGLVHIRHSASKLWQKLQQGGQ